MPTNILRKRGNRISAKDAAVRDRATVAARVVRVSIGEVSFAATLGDTTVAERIWAALPLFSVAETWGGAIHFELPVESGREPGATQAAVPGRLYFWSDEHRVILAFGPTPLSRAGEMRLPVPCNAWAVTGADVTMLAKVTPGEKVTLARAREPGAAGPKK
jgi:hypothetical protein